MDSNANIESTYMINEISNNDFLISFRKFICNISSPLLNLNNELLNEFEENINSKLNTDLLIKFSNSADISVLYIEAPSIGYPGGLSLNIDGKLQSSCISILKTKDVQLDPLRTISSQVQISSVAVESDIENNIDGNRAFFMLLQQYTKHLYAPMIRSCLQISQSNEENSSENENIIILQRRIRELDVVLEQCQRGTMVPKVILPVPSQLNEIANLTNSIILKGHLEKYNASQVDQLFDEIKLTEVLGKSQEEKEEFANIVNKSAKQWPSEIAKQTRQATESSFPASAEAEIEFWKDLDRKLADTKEQLESGPIVLTKLVLKRTNRVSEQLIRESEVELDKAMELVQISVSFLRDFPIEDLMSATDLHPKLTQTVSSLYFYNIIKYTHNIYS
jgi:dynein heavy chain 1